MFDGNQNPFNDDEILNNIHYDELTRKEQEEQDKKERALLEKKSQENIRKYNNDCDKYVKEEIHKICKKKVPPFGAVPVGDLDDILDGRDDDGM